MRETVPVLPERDIYAVFTRPLFGREKAVLLLLSFANNIRRESYLSVQRDDHRIGLVRLLTIALRVLTLIEGIVRKYLSEGQKERGGLYAGNPKRRTNQPTTERLLEAFDNITRTVISAADAVQRHITPLSSLQQDILALLGFMPVIYSQLADDS